MQRNGTMEGSKKTAVHESRFLPVTASRKRKVRGIVTRTGKYFAQTGIPLAIGRSKANRIPPVRRAQMMRLESPLARQPGICDRARMSTCPPTHFKMPARQSGRKPDLRTDIRMT